jgi:hypothetical protein
VAQSAGPEFKSQYCKKKFMIFMSQLEIWMVFDSWY